MVPFSCTIWGVSPETCWALDSVEAKMSVPWITQATAQVTILDVLPFLNVFGTLVLERHLSRSHRYYKRDSESGIPDIGWLFPSIVFYLSPAMQRLLFQCSGNYRPSCPLDQGRLVLSICLASKHAMSEIISPFWVLPLLSMSLSPLNPNLMLYSHSLPVPLT